jgi:haloacetate dehalogenase
MHMFETFSKHRINVGDVTISAVAAGSGPPVLLLHGYPQCKAPWARIAPILARSYTVVAADLRGYGDSSKPKNEPGNATYSFRTMGSDMFGLMRALGHERFHVIGHDRGGRTAYRMALDRPESVISLAVLDIAPTYSMFMSTNRLIAGAYWHWYFLSQPEPFPERLIGNDPDFFYETCLFGWGKTRLEDFDSEMLAEYRRCWRDRGMHHGSCSDYRAAASIDLEHDTADNLRMVNSPTLVFWGEHGVMHKLFDMEAVWRERLANMQTAMLPGGHFFLDQYPEESATILLRFLERSLPPART